MDRLDRLGWAAGIAVVAHGVRLGVRVTDAAVMDDVRAALPPGWRPVQRQDVDHLFSVVVGGSIGPRGSVRRLHLLYRDSTRVLRDRAWEPVRESLETELRRAVAEFSPHRVFVHAGVVSWRGRAILVPGRTFTGKTTLVAELIRAGASYYSDEYAAIDEQGRVHPFPKPLSVRDGYHRGHDVPAETFGRVGGNRGIPLGAVVLTEYRPEANWRPRHRSEGEGALALLANAVPARRRPDRVMATLGAAMPGALVMSGRRGEAAQAAVPILRAVETWLEENDRRGLQATGSDVDPSCSPCIRAS